MKLPEAERHVRAEADRLLYWRIMREGGGGGVRGAPISCCRKISSESALPVDNGDGERKLKGHTVVVRKSLMSGGCGRFAMTLSDKSEDADHGNVQPWT